MKDEDKTREQLVQELSEMRRLLNHKQMEELAYQADTERSRLQAVLDILPVGVFIVDANEQLVKANELVNKIWGDSSSSILDYNTPDRGWWTDTGKAIRAEEWPMVRALTKGETSLEKMIDILRFDGTKLTILNSAAPVLDAQGQIVGGVVVVQDITHQRQAEEMLNTAHQVADIIEFLPDSTFVIDHNKKIIAWNRAIEEMTGVCKKDIIGKGDYAYAIPFYGKPKPMLPDIILSDDKDIELDYEYFEKKESVLYAEIFSPSAFNGKGATLWGKASLLFDSDRNIIGAIESIRDISERKHMEDELKKHRDQLELMVRERTVKIIKINEQLQQEISEHKKTGEALRETRDYLENLINCANAPIIVWETSFKITRFNRSFEHLTGRSASEVIGKPLDILFPDHMREESMAHILRTVTGERWEVVEIPILNIDGTIKIVLWNSATLYGKDGKTVIATIAQGQDITERKQAEQALRLSEERFSKAFYCSPNPMIISTIIDGQFLAVNDSFLRITGYTREETIGHTAVELNIWSKSQERANMIKILYEQGAVHNLEFNLRKKSGKVGVGLLSTEKINLNGTQCLLSVINDITEHKQMEMEIARLDRLNLVGEMTASIGHEIRNPMTTVRGYLQVLAGKQEFIQYKEYFDLMIEEMDRANEIITEFLSLAKNRNIDLKIQSINHIVKAIYPLIQADAMRADKYVKLELNNAPDLLLDEKEIRQLIINLARNGLEAMTENGILTIKTYMDDGEVVLAVQDQGTEIKPNVLEKIGIPFFTTKNNGTGLGLSICYSIAARHNAVIKIETGSGGTTFFVRFMLPNNQCQQ